jgi:hypothetical protein
MLNQKSSVVELSQNETNIVSGALSPRTGFITAGVALLAVTLAYDTIFNTNTTEDSAIDGVLALIFSSLAREDLGKGFEAGVAKFFNKTIGKAVKSTIAWAKNKKAE